MATVPQRKPPSAVEAVNIGDMSSYSSGFGLPEGDYVIKSLDAVMYQYEKKGGAKVGDPALGVMMTVVSPAAPADELTQFYSMGRKAHLSFAPNPETGKGIVPLVGGAGGSLNNSTNWSVLLQSFYDSGLPPGVFTNDLSVLEGTWVHIQLIDEPEGRKDLRNRNLIAESGEQQNTGDRKIPVVSEIKDDGKPWEGSGGVPEVAAAPAPKVTPIKAGAKPVAAPAAVRKPVPAAAPVAAAAGADESDIEIMAQNGVGSVLAKYTKGCTALVIGVGAHKAVEEMAGADMASAVDDYLKANLETVLDQLGYAKVGPMVVPKPS